MIIRKKDKLRGINNVQVLLYPTKDNANRVNIYRKKLREIKKDGIDFSIGRRIDDIEVSEKLNKLIVNVFELKP